MRIIAATAYGSPRGAWHPFRLTAIKNVGRNAIDAIIAAREQNKGFTSFWEFCEKATLA